MITRQADFSAEGCDVVDSPVAALDVAGNAEEVMIIGGGQIYDLFLPKQGDCMSRACSTEIDGDAFFPAIEADSWELVDREAFAASARMSSHSSSGSTSGY